MSIRFGTDGWWAVISETFTFANLRLVAQAIADHILEETAGDDVPEVVIGHDTYDGVKYRLADGSWLLIRPSATGPVLRVYAEAPIPGQVEALLSLGERVARA